MTREVPMRMPAPTLSFLLSHPAHFIALGGGAGLAPFAPGTVGTLMAFPIAWLLDAYAGTASFLVVIAAVAAIGMALRGVASSAIDVSDGLTGDLGHILEASHAGARVDVAAIPCSDALRSMLEGHERDLALSCLLAGGDDYELCFTAPRAMQARVDGVAASLGVPLTAIGVVTEARGLVVTDEHGAPLARLPRAFDHFA